MEDLFALVLAVLAFAAYVALVGAYFVFAAPVIACVVALYVAGDLIGGYFHRMHAVVVRRAPEFELIAPYRPGTEENGPEPAYRQYFFGPALRDLRQVIVLGWQRGRGRVATLGDRFTTQTITAPRIDRLATWPIGVTLWLGLVLGALLGALLGGVFALLHAVVVVGAQLTARACTGVLMAVDVVVLRARGFHGMQCPWCYERNAYPAYRCACNRLHHDIRPGRYGVVRRRCECDRRMPTLILLGSYRMNAFCVYCDRQMSDETGRFRETVLPLLGGRAAGKTRLMAAMMIALRELESAPGPIEGAVQLSLANAETQVAYDVFSTVLDSNGYVMATSSELPHAYSVRLRVGRHTRLVHIFDPAGERLVDRDRTDELRYLPAARSFLFVLDPMAVPGFWNSLIEADQSTLDRTLASQVHPQDVFDRTLQQMIAMGSQPRKSRLTVAISKTDLVENTKLFDGRTDDEQWARWWLTDRLGLGNLIRSMDHEFREVHFHFTAAMTVGPGRVHESISPLVTRSLGIPLPNARAA
jgi:Double-GTPase 2